MKLNLTLTLLTFLFTSLACSYQEPDASKYTGEPIKVTVKELIESYDNNKVGADYKYKDKLLLVNGTISFITERNGVLGDDGYGIVFDNESSVKIIAQIVKSEKEKVANLNKGQQVSLLCFGHGMTNETIIAIRDCKIK